MELSISLTDGVLVGLLWRVAEEANPGQPARCRRIVSFLSPLSFTST